MTYSAEPPPVKTDQSSGCVLIKATAIGTAGVVLCTALTPIYKLPDGLPSHDPHIELQKPSTRVDDVRRMGATSTNVASFNPASFGNWFTTRG
jgi:hypothetical protein